MKKTLFLIFSIIIAISGNSNGSVASKNNVSSTTGTLNGHDWVDLGLPSGTKWATCNVGANSPTAYGNYYAWGETFTKSEYGESNYTYSGNPTILPPSADAATANWGNGWRMPTNTEFDELQKRCSWEWKDGGYKVTGPNGNSIFLPAAGYRADSELYYAGYYGCYWSNSLGTSHPCSARGIYFYSGNGKKKNYYRYYGFSVRAVCNFNSQK